MARWFYSSAGAYPGGRADNRARRFARLWAAVIARGLMPRRWVTLEVVGRRSGRVTRFPPGMAGRPGQWYLVSFLGEHCNWVQNVRAADGRTTLRGRRAVACRLVEVPVSERPPIIKRYLQKVPGGRRSSGLPHGGRPITSPWTAKTVTGQRPNRPALPVAPPRP